MKKRVHIIVSGRVQGVFYRACTQEKALSLNLFGWVRNLSNGNVEIVAEGEECDLENLAAWCRQGPPSAVVTSVDVAWEEAGDDLERFAIRY